MKIGAFSCFSCLRVLFSSLYGTILLNIQVNLNTQVTFLLDRALRIYTPGGH